MATRTLLLFGCIVLIIISLLILAFSGYNAIYLFSFVLMITSLAFILFRLRFGIALLVASVFLFLITNGLKRTNTASGSLLDQRISLGDSSFPIGYFILACIVLIVGSILIKSIRNNRH